MARLKITNKQKELAKKFANRLKLARENKGLSQNDLARESNISIDTIRSIESNRITSPGLFTSFTLVKALGGNLNTWMKDLYDD